MKFSLGNFWVENTMKVWWFGNFAKAKFGLPLRVYLCSSIKVDPWQVKVRLQVKFNIGTEDNVARASLWGASLIAFTLFCEHLVRPRCSRASSLPEIHYLCGTERKRGPGTSFVSWLYRPYLFSFFPRSLSLCTTSKHN